MPTTWAPPPAKRPCRAFSAGASALQVAVNANAKNARTTFLPRKAASEICRPSCACSSKSGARLPTFSVAVSVATLVRPFGRCSITHLDYEVVKTDVAKRRVTASRIDFIDGKVACPFCGTKISQRHVTREHLDVPPNPPYAASIVCPKDKEQFEVVFSDS